jgi:DNA-binding transcriptional MerR regulator
MDQALIIIDEAVRPLIPADEVAVTATMINNYVKIKLIAPSEKKKYSRDHIARLIMVTLLKRVLSMTELDMLLSCPEIRAEYDTFCAELEFSLREAFNSGTVSEESEGTSPLLAAAIKTLVCKLRFESIAAEMKNTD